jgi:DNA-nicking Smr family endonuclease
MARARGTRWPSVEDLDLFHKVLADVVPLRPDPRPPGQTATKAVVKKDKEKPTVSGLKPVVPVSNSLKTPFPAALRDYDPGRTPGLDKRSALRLQSGKTEIDGRIDLHGMTQAEARPALTGFVTRGHLQGRRCLLVITGKGRRQNVPNDGPWNGDSAGEPGVLRRIVPRWLEEAPLAACVLAYTPAQQRHGGSGALYVLLKRRRDP